MTILSLERWAAARTPRRLPSAGDPLASGMLAFLFTDIEGSTARWEGHPEAMRRVLAAHDRILRGAMLSQRGHVFRTLGDSFCAAFADPAQAVEAARAAQQALAAEDFGDVGGLRVRMAVHAGRAESRDNDYYGHAVNRVARLLGMAHGGQVLLSRVARELVLDQLPAECALLDLGCHALKDMRSAEHVYQLVGPGVAMAFPALRAPALVPSNLPHAPNALLGREEAVARLDDALARNRLVTIAGPAGIGKSRVALETARRQTTMHRDGVWLVDLGEVVPDAVVAAVAHEAGLPACVRDADALVAALRSSHVLLLLDNCDELVRECARLADLLVRRCPGVTMLATSREPLGAPGEHVERLAGLDDDAALSLFLARADGHAGPDGRPHPDLVRLCRRLDRNPLAIELAAQSSALFSARQLIRGPAEVLSWSCRGPLTRRHRSLRELFRSWLSLLNEAERSLLRSLAARGGFWTLREVDDLAQLGALVRKSFVLAEDRDRARHFRVPELLRQCALEEETALRAST